MAIIIITNKGNEEEWIRQLRMLSSELDVRIYPSDQNDEDITFALAWNPPLGAFDAFPNLKCIASTGAGVDHIIKDPDIDKAVKITRVVDQRLAKDMTSYLVAQVMVYLRDLNHYKEQEKQLFWERKNYKVPETTRIGILGLGELGRMAANKFLDLGFMVRGWSKSKKSAPNVSQFIGDEQLDEFLSNSNILICLLPLTDQTRDILNARTFEMLPKGAYVINVARGEHLVVEDLLDAVNSGHLSGACLDVFREEPLPKNHPFWTNDKITITPHVASITSVLNVAPQIIDNYRRMSKDQPLLNEIDRNEGY